MLTRLDALAACTSQGSAGARGFLSPAYGRAAELLQGWMREAGLAVSFTASGAVRGRQQGAAPAARTLVVGAPLDTLPGAGRFENVPGILLALEVLSELGRLGQRPSCAVELVAFGLDPAHRFPTDTATALVASGENDPARNLYAIDSNGMTLRAALSGIGCDVSRMVEPLLEANDILGYLEIHADRLGSLEKSAGPIGIVTTIQGVSRHEFSFDGAQARTPSQIAGRRDIVQSVGYLIGALEAVMKSQPAASATVGEMRLMPGIAGVPPVEVRIVIDVTSAVDRARRRVMLDLDREFRAIGRRRHLQMTSHEIFNRPSVLCDARFVQRLSDAAEEIGCPAPGGPGGIAHPVLPSAAQCPVGMMLMRSHPSDGTVAIEDLEIAARHLMKFLRGVPADGRALA